MNGLPARATSTWRVSSLAASGARPSFITFMPRKMKPKPRSAWPRFFAVPRRAKKPIAKPMPISRSENCCTLKARSCTVKVVPMSAPRMTPSDWRKETRPADTNPISIRVVADEDWVSAVTRAPEPTAVRRLRVIVVTQVAEMPAGGALQAFADELDAVEQQGEAAEEGEQGHRRGPPSRVERGRAGADLDPREMAHVVHRQDARAATPRRASNWPRSPARSRTAAGRSNGPGRR